MKPTSAVTTMLFACLMLAQAILAAELKTGQTATFHPDPQHLWNRLNSTLFLRVADDGNEYGVEELDILYWSRTKHLLEGPSHERALKILDEFTTQHGESLIRDPWKRAVLQRRLWQLFDWSARFDDPSPTHAARRQLQTRLAKVIRILALTPKEIEALPNNYAHTEKSRLADFPRGLGDTNNAWIHVGIKNFQSTAPAHISQFGGRSVFSVFFRHPAGRKAGIDYFDRLRLFRPIWIDATNRDSGSIEQSLNPDLPQFPQGSQWALLRRICLIDSEGQIRPTKVIESIQVRTYNVVAKKIPYEKRDTAQTFHEFQMSTAPGSPLVALQPSHRSFNTQFFSKGFDAFEYGKSSNPPMPQDISRSSSQTLKTCLECHSEAGIQSVHSFNRLFSMESSRDPTEFATAENPDRDAESAIQWKKRHFTWGLFQGLTGRN
jgi:hypothetical protein